MAPSVPSPQLRNDVRFLTTLLGDIIRLQEGDKMFEKLEEIRSLAKDIRKTQDESLITEQKKLIKTLSLDEAHKIARAFTIYFQLVNICEETERVRRIREYDRDPSAMQDMSLRKLFSDLKKQGLSAETVSDFLSKMKIELVLTAHPTEAKRRTVLDHLLRIAALLAERDRQGLTPPEREEIEHEVKETLEILWQTAELRHRKVEVLDEVDQTLFYFRRTILDLLPAMQKKIRRDFNRFFGKKNEDTDIQPFIEFGSWVGADRDGNPNVTPEITKKTAVLQKKLIVGRYLAAVEDLIRKYSQSEHFVRAGKKLTDSLEIDTKAMPDLAHDLERYELHEIYRRKFSFIHRRLKNMLSNKKPGYAESSVFIDDLVLAQESLRANKGTLAADDVSQLIDQVRIFGFHLAKLDLRDHSRKIRQLFAELFPDEEYDEETLLKKINSFAKRDLSGVQLSPGSRDLLDQLETMRVLQEKEDPNVVEDYIISMTEGPEDILALFYFACLKGLIRVSKGKVTKSSIGLIPLFESIGALQHAHDIMKRLFASPVYKSYLKSRGGTQEVMLGYSDSSKDGGYLAANWKLYLAQKDLSDLATASHLKLKLFHGKGGTIDRGGGESHKAILAQPYAASDGLLKLTEQGEVIAQKYANAVIAERNLEQLTTAVVWTNLVSKKEVEKNKKIPEWEERMEILSALSFLFYRKLVFETPAFLDFYNEATPIRVLKMTNIGSRPATRGSKTAFEDLRAIPWVFSWIQSRYIISAWYGMGYALDTYIRQRGENGLAELREMYEEWPFFRSLIHNVQTSLAKTDMKMAEQYANLVTDKEVGKVIHAEVVAEYSRAVEKVLEVCQQKELLGFHRVLRDSIRLRNPYIDPLHYMQIRFLSEFRTDPSADEKKSKKIDEILLLTVNGIAFGMKSTG